MHEDDARQRLADMFRLLGDPTRLSVALACLDEARPVGEIAAATNHSMSLVSHHLRLLRAARLVRAARDGRRVRYGLDGAHVRRMLHDMLAHAREPYAAPAGDTTSREETAA